MFEAVWQRFFHAPMRTGPTPGERERWHRGRSRYAIWLLRIHEREVRARAAQAAQALAPWITPVPAELSHITVHVAGFPVARAASQRWGPGLDPDSVQTSGQPPAPALDPAPDSAAPAPPWDDDTVDIELLARQCAAVRAARPGAPRLAVGGVNCFAGAAFLEVHDAGGGLARLRECLDSGYAGTTQREIRFSPYVPHVTVGAFCATGPVAPVLAAVAPLRRLPLVPVAPAVLELVDFDATHDGVAPFRTWAAVELGGVESAV